MEHGCSQKVIGDHARGIRRYGDPEVFNMHINDLLKIATEKGASDLHLKVGSHPVYSIMENWFRWWI